MDPLRDPIEGPAEEPIAARPPPRCSAPGIEVRPGVNRGDGVDRGTERTDGMPLARDGPTRPDGRASSEGPAEDEILPRDVVGRSVRAGAPSRSDRGVTTVEPAAGESDSMRPLDCGMIGRFTDRRDAVPAASGTVISRGRTTGEPVSAPAVIDGLTRVAGGLSPRRFTAPGVTFAGGDSDGSPPAPSANDDAVRPRGGRRPAPAGRSTADSRPGDSTAFGWTTCVAPDSRASDPRDGLLGRDVGRDGRPAGSSGTLVNGSLAPAAVVG